jgi:hypothetical protein
MLFFVSKFKRILVNQELPQILVNFRQSKTILKKMIFDQNLIKYNKTLENQKKFNFEPKLSNEQNKKEKQFMGETCIKHIRRNNYPTKR